MDIDNSIASLFKPGKSNRYFDICNPVQISRDDRTFNLWNAWWLAELSRLAYREDKHNNYEENKIISTDNILKQVGMEKIGEIYNAETSTYGLLIKVDVIDVSSQDKTPCLVLAFCGSNELQDWKINFRAYQASFYDWGNVHSGFNYAFLSIKDELLKLPEIQKYPLYITGHSLGAALATLCVLYLSDNGVNMAACYNYGSPRVGDDKFTASLSDKMIYRVINHCDIVTTLPFSFPNMRYKHAGIPCFINAATQIKLTMNVVDIEQYQKTSLVNNDDVLNVMLLVEKIKSGALELQSSFTDHAPINYVAKLERNLNL
ncbi:MAG: triacylglycerol lipase [Gammaproteobacteria bacterium]|jgi:triacylglycerol lipase